MKRAVLLLLVLSLLVIGGCTASQLTQEQPTANSAEEATPESAATDINGMLAAEDSEVEIGEMV